MDSVRDFESSKKPRKCSRQGLVLCFKENKVLIAAMLAIVFGIIFGFSVRTVGPSRNSILWIKIWGELFLRMLKMIILPMILSSLIVGLASMEYRASGIIGGATFAYIMLTNFLGSLLGISLAALMLSGSQSDEQSQEPSKTTDLVDIFADLLRNLFPENIIQACLQVVTTVSDVTVTNKTHNLTEVTKSVVYRDGMNIIGIIVFSIAFGIGVSAAGDAGRPLYLFFCGVSDVVFKIMDAIVVYSPLGIASLIAGAILETKNIEEAGRSLGMMILGLLIGCVFFTMFLEVLLFLFVRKNPLRYHRHFLEGILAGISVPSSAAALPFFLSACEHKVGVDGRIAKYTLPIQVSINRNGTAIFVCMAVNFVAQANGTSLEIPQIIVSCVLATVLSVAVPAVPSSSIVVVMLVCRSFDVPVTGGIGLLLTVEWLNDRIRTSTNVLSQAFGSVIVDRLCRKFLPDSKDIIGTSPLVREVEGLCQNTDVEAAFKEDTV